MSENIKIEGETGLDLPAHDAESGKDESQRDLTGKNEGEVTRADEKNEEGTKERIEQMAGIIKQKGTGLTTGKDIESKPTDDRNDHDSIKIEEKVVFVNRKGTQPLTQSEEIPLLKNEESSTKIEQMADFIKRKGEQPDDQKADNLRNPNPEIKPKGQDMINQMADLVKKKGTDRNPRQTNLNDSLERRDISRSTINKPDDRSNSNINEECRLLKAEVDKLRNRVNELECKDQKDDRDIRPKKYGNSDTNVQRTSEYTSVGSRRRNYEVSEGDLRDSMNMDRSRLSQTQYKPEKRDSEGRSSQYQSANKPRADAARSGYNSNSKYQQRPLFHNTTSDFKVSDSLQNPRETMTFGEKRENDSFFYRRQPENRGRPDTRQNDTYAGARPNDSRTNQAGVQTSEVFFGNYKELRLQRFENFHQKLNELMKELRVPEAMSESLSQETELKNQWRFIKSLVTGMTDAGRQRRDNEARAPPSYSANKPRMLRYN